MELRKKIIEYLQNTIITKRNLTKKIETLEEQIDKMIENAKIRNEALDSLKEKANKFQKKAREEHKLRCKLEIELNEIKNKLEKENKKCQTKEK